MSLKILEKILGIGEEQNGYTEMEIQKAETRIGVKLPVTIRMLYLHYGKNEKVNFDNYLIPPELLEIINEEYLVFYSENQAIYRWAVKVEDLLSETYYIYRIEENNKVSFESATIEKFMIKIAMMNAQINYPFKTWTSDVNRSEEDRIKKVFSQPKTIFFFNKSEASYYWNGRDQIISIIKDQNKKLKRINVFMKKKGLVKLYNQ